MEIESRTSSSSPSPFPSVKSLFCRVGHCFYFQRRDLRPQTTPGSAAWPILYLMDRGGERLEVERALWMARSARVCLGVSYWVEATAGPMRIGIGTGKSREK